MGVCDGVDVGVRDSVGVRARLGGERRLGDVDEVGAELVRIRRVVDGGGVERLRGGRPKVGLERAAAWGGVWLG